MTDDAMHNALARLPERLAESFTQEVRRTHVAVFFLTLALAGWLR